MRTARPAASWIWLVLAVFSLGIMAGFFGTYSANVNLATRGLDGPTYALVQSALNVNVRHPLFFAFFFGPPCLCALALTQGWRERPGWWWLVGLIGVGYALGIVLFTREVNLPLNHLTESWTPSALPADWAATRDAWSRANAWRAAWSALLFALGLIAMAWRAMSPGPEGCAVTEVDQVPGCMKVASERAGEAASGKSRVRGCVDRRQRATRR